MITLEQFFRGKPHSAAQALAARDLLDRVNLLTFDCHQDHPTYDLHVDPDTGTLISGAKGGTGGGGFRLPHEGTTEHTAHKILWEMIDGEWFTEEVHAAVDVYDPRGELDEWLDDKKLEKYGLYREHPDATPGWCHLTTRPPPSGHRTFRP